MLTEDFYIFYHKSDLFESVCGGRSAFFTSQFAGNPIFHIAQRQTFAAALAQLVLPRILSANQTAALFSARSPLFRHHKPPDPNKKADILGYRLSKLICRNPNRSRTSRRCLPAGTGAIQKIRRILPAYTPGRAE